MRARRLGIAFALLAAAPRPAAAPARRTANVILVTTDGLRWQEVFSGAEDRLLVKENGVEDPAGLRREFGRDSAEGRREALLPFLWSVVARQGQIYGNRER